jgi:hypothetical protein
MGYSILYPWYNSALPQTNKAFKEFARNENNGCLKKMISEHFPGNQDPIPMPFEVEK